MKIFRQVCGFFGAIAVACAFVFVNPSTVFAEDQATQRIQISPAREDIGDLKPGEKYNGTFKVQNIGTEELKFSVGVSPYTVTNEE